MNPEGLDCWDDYPYEHGCICGNDCPPPPLPLDPAPWLDVFGHGRRAHQRYERDAFAPRRGYSQNINDYQKEN